MCQQVCKLSPKAKGRCNVTFRQLVARLQELGFTTDHFEACEHFDQQGGFWYVEFCSSNQWIEIADNGTVKTMSAELERQTREVEALK
jgi:hypothetical protein